MNHNGNGNEDQMLPAVARSGAPTGILIVHGIGEQQAGEVLTQAAGPILEVLGRFAELSANSAPEILDADLHPEEGPARLTIGPIYAEGSEQPASTWLITEARWADSFKSPSLSRMLLWSLKYTQLLTARMALGRPKVRQLHVIDRALILASIRLAGPGKSLRKQKAALEDEDSWVREVSSILVQYGYSPEDVADGEHAIRARFRTLAGRIQSKSRRLLPEPYVWESAISPYAGVSDAVGLSAALVMLVVGTLLLPLLLLALTSLAILSIIPGLSSPFRRIRSALERTVGDAFVFTKDPVGRAAMLASVRRSAEWMEENCAEFVVVAHSQGSVIVENLLARGELTTAARVIVYGSAIGLLEKPSRAWVKSDQWVSYRAALDPVAPERLLSSRSLTEDLDTWDHVFEGWTLRRKDHTDYWTEREGFVIGLVAAVAAAQADTKLARWASKTRSNLNGDTRGFRKAFAKWTGYALAGVGVSALAITDIPTAIGQALFEITLWVLSILPDAIGDLVGVEALRSSSWISDVELAVGLVVLAFVIANGGRRLAWAIGSRRSVRAKWNRHSAAAAKHV